MNPNESSQITSGALAEECEVQGITSPHRNEVVQLNDEASNAIVQCLLIAARRGRQLRLACLAQPDLQQEKSTPIGEDTLQPAET